MLSLLHSRFFLRSSLALASCASLAFSSVASAEPLREERDRLFIGAEVNGVPVDALLDSGAELSVADTTFAQEAHVGSGEEVAMRGTGAGESSARIVEGVRISAAGVTLDSATIAVTDLGDVSARLIGRPLRFVLGRDFFDAGRWKVDLQAHQIAAFAYGVPTGERLPLASSKGIETIPVTVGGVSATADFDLGNGSDVRISQALADRLRLDPVGMEPAGGIGGAGLTPVVFIPELIIAGHPFRAVRAHVSPAADGADLNVGLRILRHFRMVIDFPGRAVWLDYAGI